MRCMLYASLADADAKKVAQWFKVNYITGKSPNFIPQYVPNFALLYIENIY